MTKYLTEILIVDPHNICKLQERSLMRTSHTKHMTQTTER